MTDRTHMLRRQCLGGAACEGTRHVIPNLQTSVGQCAMDHAVGSLGIV